MKNARILFVGVNPGLRSGAIGHHFAGRGNPFWRLLFAAQLTPLLLAPEEDARLAEFRLGLVNLCHRPTRSAAELTAREIALGRTRLSRRIERLAPNVVAFVGLMLFRDFLGKKGGGVGERPERIHGARAFVLPNTSGLNAHFPGFQAKLIWFQRLKEFADRMADERDRGRREI